MHAGTFPISFPNFSAQIWCWYLDSLTCGLIPGTRVWTKKRDSWTIWLKMLCKARGFDCLIWLIWVSSEQMPILQFGWERRMQWQSGVRTACTGAYLVFLTHGLMSCQNWSVVVWRQGNKSQKRCIPLLQTAKRFTTPPEDIVFFVLACSP